MKKYIKKAISHPLIKGSTIILAGSLGSNILNYLFNLILGRFLIVTDYGTYAALISFMGIFGTFSSTFTSIFAKFAAMFQAKKEQDLKILFFQGLKIILFLATIVLCILLVLTFSISTFLKIQDIRLLILIFLTIFLSIISSLPTGFLQGEMRLYTSSFFTIITPLMKILIAILLLVLGQKVFGVTVAIFISSLLTLVFLILIFRNIFRNQQTRDNQSLFLKDFRRYGIHFFFSTLGITILTTADVILVKNFFSKEMAGQYAALSVMGRAIFYVTSPIYFVFFPLIAQKKEKNENIHNTLLLATFIITACSVSLSFIYFIFPRVILNIFFPSRDYSILVSFLGPFSLYVIVFSIAMLFNSFLLSIGKTNVYKINLIIAFLFIVLMCFFHSSFYQVIAVLFSTSLVLLLVYLVYYALSICKKTEK